MSLKSTQIVYSEHYDDECFEYKTGGRVPEGNAIGYVVELDEGKDKLILFDDIKYSEYDHDYWDNYELEHDVNRLFVP
jgi:hypothetical protein